MKQVPCDFCKGRPALASRIPEIAHLIGSLVGSEKIRCARCGRTVTVTPMLLARQPDIPLSRQGVEPGLQQALKDEQIRNEMMDRRHSEALSMRDEADRSTRKDAKN